MGLIKKTFSSWDSNYGPGVKKKALDLIEAKTMSEMLPEAKSQCPVKYGPLRDSGNVIRDGNSVLIGFGKGPSQKYAVVQHERMDYHHKVGKAKYLQDPFNQMSKKIIDESLKEAMK